MVKLEEVLDEEFANPQVGPADSADDWDDASSDDSDSTFSDAGLVPDESVYERISALQDIVPASTRRSLGNTWGAATSWVKSGLLLGGKTLWVVSTSALLLGVPWALAYAEEQMVVEQEREAAMAQRNANEFLAPGAPATGQTAQPAI